MNAAGDYSPIGPDRLTEKEIAARLRGQSFRPAAEIPGLVLRPAAVLVPLLQEQGEWSLLFTHRTETVQSHKGQVSFPGGGAEPGDHSPEETALREAHEEVGLLAEHVSVLGTLPDMATITSFLVTPVVGRVRWPYSFTLSVLEVEKVFTIPLGWLADPVNRDERPRINRLGPAENVIYFRPYQDEILWGVSARIVVEFLQILGL